MGVEGGDRDPGQWDDQGSDARQERILVSVRLRPLNAKEIQSNDFVDWECTDDNTIVFKNVLGERSMFPNSYTFDRVFGFSNSTKEVYEKAAKKVALSVLNGLNASVFAYGQTSSGKTFTMGGITQNAVTDIYDYMDQHPERQFVLKFSAMEIYNEQVRDLLSFDPTPLRLLDDPEKGTVVDRLTEEIVRDKSQLLELIAVCEAQRQTGETSLNETSSRSHQILRLTIESSARQFGSGDSSLLAANVNFVDLAGSERTSQTQTTGTRLKEGSHINRSLLTLGKVIRKLSKGRNGHVPYRDSKLTRILHNSLGGNARTAIICTMSPAHSHLEQSRNTLMFASCAKEVTTNAKVNVMMSDKALVKHLRKELSRLERELKTMNLVSTKGDDAAVLKEKELQIEKMDREIRELCHQRDLAQSKVEQLLQSAVRNQGSRLLDEGSYHQNSDSREKMSWIDDSSMTSDTTDYQRLDADLARSESFQYLDEHGNFDLSYEQTDGPLENFGQDLLADESSPHLLSHNIPDFPLHSDDQSHGWEKMITGRTKYEGSDDECKEVRCIEVEQQSINRETELPKPEKISPQQEKENNIQKEEKEQESFDVVENEYPSSFEKKEQSINGKTELPEPEKISPQQEETENKMVKEEKEQESFKVDENEYTISFEKKEKREPHCSDAEYEALVKRIKDLQRTIDHLVNSSLVERPSTHCSTEPEKRSSGGLILKRSRSCKAVLYTTSSSPTFSKMVVHNRDQSFGGFGREVISRRPMGLPVASSDPNDAHNGRSSRLGFPNSIRTLNEMEQDVEHSDASDNFDSYSSVARTNEDAKPESDKQTGCEMEDRVVEDKCLVQNYGSEGEEQCLMQNSNAVEEEGEEEPKDKSKSGENAGDDDASYAVQVRDCMSEGAPSSAVESPISWQEEFENQRLKIIELWHACNTPLVHRTYFYLLFKGDPSDKLYMEVELRRLSFIKDRFSQGQRIVMDGQVFTPSSSMQALNQEREMLMRQVYKRIPAPERGTLFQKWGISINSKQRRLQLVRCLWTDPKDMRNIKDSATLVAKLVGFIDDGQIPKEMFVGPSFVPKTLSRISHSWKSGMSS